MYFKIKLFGFELKDLEKDFEDKIEELAGDILEQAQIKHCLEGKEYFIYDDFGNPEYLEPIEKEEFEYYYNLFDTIELLGLPHGQGWINEQEWVIHIYKAFKKTFEAAKISLEIKAMKQHGKN